MNARSASRPVNGFPILSGPPAPELGVRYPKTSRGGQHLSELLKKSGELTWLNTDAGHLILMQASTRPRWSGIEAPRDGRSIAARFRWNQPTDPPTDYDRACDVDAVVGILDVDGQPAVVLAQEPMPATCQLATDGHLLISRLYTSEIGLPRSMPAVGALAWQSVGRVSFDGSPLVLFDSTEVGWAEPVFPSLEVAPPAGCFEVEHAVLNCPEMELWLVRLRRI